MKKTCLFVLLVSVFSSQSGIAGDFTAENAETAEEKSKLQISASSAHSAVKAGDWPQWLGPNRDGISTEAVCDELLATPRLLWRASVGVGVSSVVKSGGRAFAMGHVRGPDNRGKDTIYCFDADTGGTIWRYSYGCLSCKTQDVRVYGPRSTPTVDGDLLYTLSLEGHLFCFEAGSGKIIWSKELPRDYNGRIPVYGYCCSPLVYGKLLILELNAKPASYVALDKSNGQILWQLAGGGNPAIKLRG
jgi:outer membrane protein assembly factor BamB